MKTGFHNFEMGIRNMESWHPKKLAMVLGIIGAIMGMLGGVASTSLVFGKALRDVEILVRDVATVKEDHKTLEKRMDASEVDRSAMRQWIKDACETLTEFKLKQNEIMKKQEEMLKVQIDNNKILKKAF